MAYQAPIITDRVAEGDNKYTTADLGNNKISLTPAPDSVTEAGTDINKALLQPLVNTVQQNDADLIPFTDYWWRRYSTPAGYSEVRVIAAGQFNFFYSHTIHSGDNAGTSQSLSKTLQYASSISINQSTGVVSLASPTTITVTYETYTNAQLQALFANKYIKASDSTTIYFIPQASYVITYSYRYVISGVEETGWYTCYDASAPDGYKSTKFYTITSEYNSASGDVKYVSSPDSTTYPHDGTENGFTYEYIGLPIDSILASDGATHIELGTYTGTGTHGESNPNSLTFSTVPKMVIISYNGTSSYGLFFGNQPRAYVNVPSPGAGTSTTGIMSCTWSGKTLSWYAQYSSNATIQLNISQKPYIYYAIM